MTTYRRMRTRRGRVMHAVVERPGGGLESLCRQKSRLKGVNTTYPRAHGPAADWSEDRYWYPDCKHCPPDDVFDSTSPRS
jgi:hypothetical protein